MITLGLFGRNFSILSDNDDISATCAFSRSFKAFLCDVIDSYVSCSNYSVITRKASLVVSLVSVIPRCSRDCALENAPLDIALARSLRDASGIVCKYNTEDNVLERQAYKIKNVLKRGRQSVKSRSKWITNRGCVCVGGFLPAGETSVVHY
jgi:hypothetical protein